VAKTGGPGMSQSEILIKSGIAARDVPAFQDPMHWLRYFPPYGACGGGGEGWGWEWV
jgi:hypothetical protein